MGVCILHVRTLCSNGRGGPTFETSIVYRVNFSINFTMAIQNNFLLYTTQRMYMHVMQLHN